jgi:hypothetical protein
MHRWKNKNKVSSGGISSESNAVRRCAPGMSIIGSRRTCTFFKVQDRSGGPTPFRSFGYQGFQKSGRWRCQGSLTSRIRDMRNREIPKCETAKLRHGISGIGMKSIKKSSQQDCQNAKCETRFGSAYGHNRWSHQWKMGEGASADKLLFSEFWGPRLGSVENAHIKDVERRNHESALWLCAWSQPLVTLAEDGGRS